MASKETMPADGIEWSELADWVIHSGKTRYLVKINYLQASTYEYLLWEDSNIRLYGHYTISKEKLVGYSLAFVNWRSLKYVERPWYIGIFTNIKDPNQHPEQVFADKNIRLVRFNRKSHNYVFAIRWQPEKEVSLTV